MKAIKKIRALTTRGELIPAITLAIQTTKENTPLKDQFYQLGKEVKQLQSDYKNQFIEDFTYRKELNLLINRFIQTTNELAAKPEFVKKQKLKIKWWVWPLLLLAAWLAYKWLNRPTLPEQEMTLAFVNDKFILSAEQTAPSTLTQQINQLNELHQQKKQFQNWIGEKEVAPLIHFREKESTMQQTIQQLESSYQHKVSSLKEAFHQKYGKLLIKYSPNSAQLDTDYHASLKQWAQMLLSTPHQLRIVGFTDPTGSKKQNEKLSCERAHGVRDFLVAAAQKTGEWSDKIQVSCGSEANSQILVDERKVELSLLGPD